MFSFCSFPPLTQFYPLQGVTFCFVLSSFFSLVCLVCTLCLSVSLSFAFICPFFFVFCLPGDCCLNCNTTDVASGRWESGQGFASCYCSRGPAFLGCSCSLVMYLSFYAFPCLKINHILRTQELQESCFVYPFCHTFLYLKSTGYRSMSLRVSRDPLLSKILKQNKDKKMEPLGLM